MMHDPLSPDAQRLDLAGLLASIVDFAAEGREGQALVEALDHMGLATNPALIRDIYERHRAAIDEFAGAIDTEALVRRLIGDSTPVEFANGVLSGFQPAEVAVGGAVTGGVLVALFASALR